jgi:uncharacterized membrane protein
MKLKNKKLLILLSYYLVSVPIFLFGAFFMGQSWFLISALLVIAGIGVHWLTR